MDVLYDARSEAAAQAAAQIPALSEWLQSYPKLNSALVALSVRFIINLPEENLRDPARLCFELQEAFWFYLDYLYEGAKRDLPKLNQLSFVTLMVEADDVLQSIYSSTKARQQLFQDWRDYCRRVPLKGAVLLNAQLDKCLMVQPWKGDKWTYPRGKINEDESEGECAIREVWEETGIDISGRIDTSEFVKHDAYGTGCPVKLFLVQGIPLSSPCAPHTRKEIAKIGWIQLNKLPGWDPRGEESKLKFSCVEPFVPDIRRWVEGRRALAGSSSALPSKLSFGQATPARATPSSGPSEEAKLPQRGRRKGNGSAGGARESTASGPGKENGVCPAKENGAGRDAPLILDMAKVMREFDLGWERAERGARRRVDA